MKKKKVNKKVKPKIDKTENLRQKVVDDLKLFIIHYVQTEKFCNARTAGKALETIMSLKNNSQDVGFSFMPDYAAAKIALPNTSNTI